MIELAGIINTTSVILWGEIDTHDNEQWTNFYHYSLKLFNSVGLVPNYMGVSGESFKSGKS